VSLKAYGLVRHPISQAQWRSVVALPTLEHDLSLTSGIYEAKGLWESYGQPGGLAVDSVSWIDCQEWMKRLNHWLSEQWLELGGQGQAPVVDLPSESQWEVACRTGASTPFHFGATLDASWANFNASYRYGPSRQGDYRQRPRPVGFFGLVNRWGLAEMHGQLLEWCADQWRRDPLAGAPGEGSPLEGPDPELEGNQEQSYRLLRGGSWIDDPPYCRAAMRVSYRPDYDYTVVGVRPAVSLPRHPSPSEPLEGIPAGVQEAGGASHPVCRVWLHDHHKDNLPGPDGDAPYTLFLNETTYGNTRFLRTNVLSARPDLKKYTSIRFQQDLKHHPDALGQGEDLVLVFMEAMHLEPPLTIACSEHHLLAEGFPVQQGVVIELFLLPPKPRGGGKGFG
jgi:formylglycine-generating enzyme required for sulfatase activity